MRKYEIKIPILSQRTRQGWGTHCGEKLVPFVRTYEVKIPTSRKGRETWGTLARLAALGGTGEGARPYMNLIHIA